MSEVNENGVANEATATAVVPVEKKGKGKGKKNKPLRPVWGKPQDKLVSHETPGFLAATHAKLKPSDFADPLDWCKWEAWYFSEKLRIANNNIANMQSLGSTPEERKANQREAQLLSALEAVVARRLQSGKGLGGMADRLASLFGSTQTQ